MKLDLEQPIQPEEKLDLQEDIERCDFALQSLGRFEKEHDASSAWVALNAFRTVIFFLEKLPSPQALNKALEYQDLNEKLTVLLNRIKQANILETEEYLAETGKALPDVPSAREIVKKVREAILRVEIYLSSVLEKKK